MKNRRRVHPETYKMGKNSGYSKFFVEHMQKSRMKKTTMMKVTEFRSGAEVVRLSPPVVVQLRISERAEIA